MQSRVLRRLAQAALLLGAGMLLVSTAEARPSRPGPRGTRSGFSLFAGATNVLLLTNRVQCNIDNIGQQCVDPNDSPSIGGGFWPKGSPDQYIFNGGLQIGAIVAGATGSSSPFGWTGDTVGVFFMDPRGGQNAGEGITPVYSSLNTDDMNNWPPDAYVQDTSLFAPSLINRKAISQQDTWTRYWDGNPGKAGGRKHSMGVLVDQRGLAWNFPSGNEDIVYFLFRFINITAASSSGAYDSLLVAGYTPDQILTVGQIADDFRSRAAAAYNVTIPPEGFTFHQTFVNYFQDPDEGNSGFNYSTAILPFAETNVIKADFSETQWAYPPTIFAAPFAPAPGFEGIKYLKSPINPATGRPFGITVWGNTSNGPPFNDAVGTSQMYRYISATNSPAYGDPACNVNGTVAVTHTCYAVQSPVDTRYFMSSGPFELKPGQSAVIVAAAVHAAPVGSLPATGSGIYALPQWSLTPFITPGTGTLKPGFPATAESLAIAGAARIRDIERAAGWMAFSDANADGIIDQSEVQTVPRSLLDKDKVAQAVFDNKFLLPFAPDAPLFFLVPGDGKVTLAWQKSKTETDGDPYFDVASQLLNPDLTANALYDPNYRKYDVEGYRIWRGRTQAEMQVIAQFDYAGTSMTDYTGQFWNSSYGSQCAPELGVEASCPVAFTYPYAGSGPTNDIPLSGDVIQVPPGGRVQLANGNIFIVTADTAVTGGATGFPGLSDTGVPFAYIDNNVLNGVQYYYAVTAFDVNSVKSGPSSLESPLVTKIGVPRATGTNAVNAVVVTGMYGDDGVALNPGQPWPEIDAASGTFNGIIPPANAASFGFLASVSEALPVGEYLARIDSVGPGLADGYGISPNIYLTFKSATDSLKESYLFQNATYAVASTDTVHFETAVPFVPYDSSRSRQLGIAFTEDTRMPVKFTDLSWPPNATPMGAALTRGRWASYAPELNQATRFLMLGYWYDEGGAQPPNPTIDPFGSAAHSAGKLTGVSLIYAPAAYRQPTSGNAADHSVNIYTRAYSSNPEWYPADFVVTWGSGGTVTVRDSTHHVTLPYKKQAQPGYGFISGAAIVNAGVTSGELDDGNVGTTFDPSVVSYYSLYTIERNCTDYWGITCADLQQTAALEPIDVTTDGISDGNGVALVINGEPFFFLMSSLPAAGTKWHLKDVGGGVMSATCTPALPSGTGSMTLGGQPTSCSGYSFAPLAFRPAYAAGLTFKIQVTQGFSIAKASGDMNNIHTVPDPYYVTNALEVTANTKVLRFVNLPAQAIIRIYSASGILVNVLAHSDPTGGGEQVWNLRNRNNQFVASGVYFYHVEAADGRTKIGRFTVVNYAQ